MNYNEMFKHKNVESVQPHKLGKGSFSKACRCDSTCMLNWLLLLLHVSCVIFDLHHLCPYKIIQECSMQCMNYVWKMCTEILWSCNVPQYGPHPVPLWCAQNGPVFAAQLWDDLPPPALLAANALPCMKLHLKTHQDLERKLWKSLETVKFNLLNLLPGTIARRDLLVALTSLLNFCCLSLLMSAIVSLSILSNFNCSSAGPQRQPLLLQLPQPCRLTKDCLGN